MGLLYLYTTHAPTHAHKHRETPCRRSSFVYCVHISTLLRKPPKAFFSLAFTATSRSFTACLCFPVRFLGRVAFRYTDGDDGGARRRANQN